MVNKDDENKSYNYFSLGGQSDPPQGSDFPFYDDNDGGDDDFSSDPEEACWMFKSIAALMSIPKPFGTMFSFDQEKDFLEKRGYRVEEVKCGEDVNPTGILTIAVKKGKRINKANIEELSKYSIGNVFVEEVQGIILKWLLKIGEEE